jgi:hypothetical protein
VNHARSLDSRRSPPVAPAWPEHFCGRVSEEPRLGLGWALPSVVRAKVRAFKTVLNIEVAPDNSRQHPKKVAHDSEDVWRGLPCEPGSLSGLPLNGGQHGLLERR